MPPIRNVGVGCPIRFGCDPVGQDSVGLPCGRSLGASLLAGLNHLWAKQRVGPSDLQVLSVGIQKFFGLEEVLWIM